MNKLQPRLRVVERKLERRNGLILDPRHCRMLRRGFNAGYMYRVQKGMNTVGSTMPHLPVKNEYSHIHDALQYGLLGSEQGPMEDSLPPWQSKGRRKIKRRYR